MVQERRGCTWTCRNIQPGSRRRKGCDSPIDIYLDLGIQKLGTLRRQEMYRPGELRVRLRSHINALIQVVQKPSKRHSLLNVLE